MDEQRTATLGTLISELDEIASWNRAAAEANSKVTQAPELGTLSCHYALRASEYHSNAEQWMHKVLSICGYDKVRALCEAEGGRVTGDRLRQLRGQYCLALEMSIDVANAVSVEDFVSAVLLMRRGEKQPFQSGVVSTKVKAERPVLAVSSWSELAIGIRENWTYCGIVPAPCIGDAFPISQAKSLKLPGDRWKNILTVLADAADPQVITKVEVIQAIGLLPPPRNDERDGRARPNAVESALRSELPATEQPANTLLTSTLADLRRELRLLVDGPKGKKNCCLAIEGKAVRPGFVVRYLLDGPSGQKRFGQRPE
jgi:hypothetical protein